MLLYCLIAVYSLLLALIPYDNEGSAGLVSCKLGYWVVSIGLTVIDRSLEARTIAQINVCDSPLAS